MNLSFFVYALNAFHYSIGHLRPNGDRSSLRRSVEIDYPSMSHIFCFWHILCLPGALNILPIYLGPVKYRSCVFFNICPPPFPPHPPLYDGATVGGREEIRRMIKKCRTFFILFQISRSIICFFMK